MEDVPYSPQNIAALDRPIFEQLASSYPEYEVWQRHENFHRRLSAGVVNRATGVAITIAVVRGSQMRTQLLSASELAQVGKHLESLQDNDLAL